jgi:hypothetical protein
LEFVLSCIFFVGSLLIFGDTFLSSWQLVAAQVRALLEASLRHFMQKQAIAIDT